MRQFVALMRSEEVRSACGRPEIDIPEEQLSYLVEQNFRTNDISTMFGCSRRTIERRMKTYRISHWNTTSEIDDACLDLLVRDIAALFPQCGEKTVNGRLRSSGIRVPRLRIRESLRRVDPSGIHHRCRGVLHRRKYVQCYISQCL